MLLKNMNIWRTNESIKVVDHNPLERLNNGWKSSKSALEAFYPNGIRYQVPNIDSITAVLNYDTVYQEVNTTDARFWRRIVLYGPDTMDVKSAVKVPVGF